MFDLVHKSFDGVALVLCSAKPPFPVSPPPVSDETSVRCLGLVEDLLMVSHRADSWQGSGR